MPVEDAPVDELADDDPPTAEIAAGVSEADVSAAADDGEPGVSASESSGELPPGKVQGRRSPSGRGSRRAAVPTWDDIMFGMKPKDGS